MQKIIQILFIFSVSLLFHTALAAQLRDREPTNIQFEEFMQKADSLMDLGELEILAEGLQAFKKEAVQLNDRQKITLYNYSGQVNIELEQNTQAIMDLESAHELHEKLYTQIDSQRLEILFNLGSAFSSKGEFKKGNGYYENVIKKGKKHFDQPHELVGNSYSALGSNLEDLGLMNQAVIQYDSALAILNKIYSKPHPDIGKVYNSLGVLHRELYNLELAKDYYEKALVIFTETVGENHFNVLAVYYNLGVMLHVEGDYGRSFDYVEKSLNIAHNLLGDDHPVIATLLELQSSNYLKLNKPDQAIEKIKQAERIRLPYKDESPFEMHVTYHVAGGIYSELEEYPKALAYYKKAHNVLQSLDDDIPLDLAINYGLTGIAYSNIGDFEKANQYLQKAYKNSSEAIGEQHPEPAGHLTEWAFVKLLERDYEGAEQKFDKAARDFGYDSSGDLPYQNISDYAYFLDALIGKGTAIMQRGQRDNDAQTLNRAMRVFNQAADVLSMMKINFNDPLSKLSNIDKYYELFEKQIETQLLLYEHSKDDQYLKQAILSSEESKAYLLLENLRNIDARKFSGLPESLLAKESRLKARYSHLQQQLFDESQEEEIDKSITDGLQQRIFIIKQELNDLINDLKKNHANYYNLKYKKEPIDFAQLQNELPSNESLIEYFVGDSSIYIFHIVDDKIDYRKVKKDFPLDTWVSEIQEGLTAYYRDAGEQSIEVYARLKALYQQRAYQLYEKLIQPIGSLKSNLRIIPDGVLWQLPFETLLAADYNGNFKNAPYLIHDHSVSYQYGLQYWMDLKQRPKVANNMLAMAPTFEFEGEGQAESVFQNLKYNREEVEGIVRFTKSEVFSDKEARKSTFLNRLSANQDSRGGKKYGIIHLATHAQLNTDNNAFSFLAFAPYGPDTADWKLYVNELYNLEIDANMVVLSACEAGAGSLQKGEGLTSLGRGIAYAGGRNIVSTLWKVNDQSTAHIMASFYKDLKEGTPIDESLRQSKLTYLQDQKEDRLASPYYWAAFTTIGHTASLRFEKRWDYVYIAFPLLLLAGFWFVRKWNAKDGL